MYTYCNNSDNSDDGMETKKNKWIKEKMYTDDNNSNNDKDMEKKNNIYTINDKKEMGIKTLFVTEGKIRTRQGFKSGNWGN